MYCITKEITGLEKDLVFDSNLNLIKKERSDDDIVICKDTNKDSISYFSKHEGTELSLEIPVKYQNMWGFIKNNPNWSNVLGMEKFVSMCKKLLRQTKNFVENENNKYYTDIVKKHYDLFKEIEPAKVSEKNLLKYISSIENYHAKKLLLQINKETKYFNKIEYTLFKSSTGRMTVENGLNLLTLKKDFRNIIESSYDEGKVLEIDIKNLEPRILMGMSNKEVPEDIYTWIAKIVLDKTGYNDDKIDNVQRNFIKELTFKILYGASMSTIKKDLKDMDWLYDIEDIVGRIKSNMGYHELAIKIKKEMNEGYFTNFYGRKLKNSTSNINHYLQSTGVDVSLMCFSKVNEVLKSAGLNFKIIGFIHDAMIIDADKKSSDSILKNLNEKNIEVKGFNNKFPIIIKEIK
jgi:DNA polymerase I-like protein with 3'-5' exonuclease and polymerase domains